MQSLHAWPQIQVWRAVARRLASEMGRKKKGLSGPTARRSGSSARRGGAAQGAKPAGGGGAAASTKAEPKGTKRKSGTADINKTGAGSWTDYSVAEPPVKRVNAKTKPEDRPCARCGSASKDWAFLSDAGQKLGDACMECWHTFCSAYKKPEGPATAQWNELCDTCTHDQGANDQFSLASGIRSAEVVAPWKQAQVIEGDSAELHTVRSFVGVPRQDFIDITGVTPNQAGLTEIDIPNDQGVIFKGVVCINPQRPFVELELRNKKAVSKDTHRLKLEDHCVQSIADTKFDASKEVQSKSAIVTKLRNCSLTAEDVDAQLDEPKFQAFFRSLGYSQPVAQGVGKGSSASTQVKPLTIASPRKQAHLDGAALAMMTSPAKVASDMDDAVSVMGSVYGRQKLARASSFVGDGTGGSPQKGIVMSGSHQGVDTVEASCV